MTDTLKQTDINLKFKWEIHNFLDRKEKKGKCIVSPKFSVCDLSNVTGDCYLRIFPRGKEKSNSTDVVAIQVTNVCDKDLILYFTISIIDRSGIERKGKSPFYQSDFPPGVGYGIEHFVPRDELVKEANKLLSVKGSLTIQLEIRKPGPNAPVTWLKNDLENSFADMKFPDRQIKCNGETFDCHRFVLCSRKRDFTLEKQ